MKPVPYSKAVATAIVTGLILLCTSHYVQAQTQSIRLVLTDNATHQPLFYAGATLINLKDSMIVCTQTTQADGTAQFNISKEGRYKLLIESEGYVSEARYPIISKEYDRMPIHVAMKATTKKQPK